MCFWLPWQPPTVYTMICCYAYMYHLLLCISVGNKLTTTTTECASTFINTKYKAAFYSHDIQACTKYKAVSIYLCRFFSTAVSNDSRQCTSKFIIVRRAGLLWSQQDFEWRWSVPLFKCLTVLEFSFILFDLYLLITFFNFIMNYVPIVTFWIFTYHKILILSIMFCFIWSYWIIYFLACLEVSWRVVS